MFTVTATYHKETTIQDQNGNPQKKLWLKDVYVKVTDGADIFIGSALANINKTLSVASLIPGQKYRMNFTKISKFNDFFPELINPTKIDKYYY